MISSPIPSTLATPTPAAAACSRVHGIRHRVVPALLLSGLALAGCSSSATPAASSQAPSSAASSPAAAALTLSEVAKHNTAASCWAAVDGDVYDLTAWIAKHPGGPDKISALCGTDATAGFTGKHGAPDGGGNPQQRLASFKLGPLVS